MKLYTIETGTFKLDGGAMFGVVPKQLWQKTNPADENNQDEQIAVAKLYDVIRNQKQAIEDERAVYFELLAEHDDLLAQYALLDLLTASLKNALSREVGQDAVQVATKEAEENAEAQYGRFVKLT